MSFRNVFSSNNAIGAGPEVDLEVVSNLSIKDIRKWSIRLCDNYPIDVREDALIQIGHCSYMGGREAAKAAANYLEEIIDLYTSNKHTFPSTRIACAKCIAELCHGHRQTREFLGKDRNLIQFMTYLIKNTGSSDSVRVGRWTTYALFMIMNATPIVMEELKEDEELHQALVVAADYKRPWTGWGGNIADHILKLLYHRDPSEEVLLF